MTSGKEKEHLALARLTITKKMWKRCFMWWKKLNGLAPTTGARSPIDFVNGQKKTVVLHVTWSPCVTSSTSSQTPKKTGDPSCPPAVRQAKHIARAIEAKCSAYTLDDSSEEDVEGAFEESESTEQAPGTSHNESEDKTVGVQKKKRKTAATGKPRNALKSEELLLQHVGQMTEHIGSILQVLMGEKKMDDNDNTLK